MNDALVAYFTGEKNAGLVLAGVGAVMAVAAVVLFPARLELRPLAVTLGVWAVLELAVGGGLFITTGPRVEDLLSRLAADPAALVAAELPRMVRVQRNFAILEAVWVVLIVASALVVWRVKGNPTLAGVAMGLLINAAVVLAFDTIAERRGATYHAALSAARAS